MNLALFFDCNVILRMFRAIFIVLSQFFDFLKATCRKLIKLALDDAQFNISCLCLIAYKAVYASEKKLFKKTFLGYIEVYHTLLRDYFFPQ